MDAAGLRLRGRRARDARRLLRQEFLDQMAITLSLIEQLPNLADDIAVVFPLERFNGSLTNTLFSAARPTYLDFGNRAALGWAETWRPSRVDGFVFTSSFYSADSINQGTRRDVGEALARPDAERMAAVEAAFESLLGYRLTQWSETLTTAMANAGMHDAAWQARFRSKVWEANSDTDRHAGLDGEMVALGETFSNGLRWPGDLRGDVAETANCECTIRFERDGGE